MKKIFLLSIAVMCLNTTSKAQDNADSKYTRNSIYMMKLDMAPENEEYKHAFEIMNKTFDGIDFAISGHTHTPEYSPHGKIRVSSNSTMAYRSCYKELVVDAHLTPGGYGLKKEYEIAPPPELQYLELTKKKAGRESRTEKIINYHAIQL